MTLYISHGDTTTRSDAYPVADGTLGECQAEAAKHPDTGDGWNSMCWIEDENSNIIWDRDFPI